MTARTDTLTRPAAAAPEHALAWVEIPVSDMDRAKAFYNKTLDVPITVDQAGPMTLVRFTTANRGVAGSLIPGTPGRGPIPHLTVSDLPAALARAASAGGKVTSEIIPIPVGSFAYLTDSEGNSIGLFQPAA